MKAIQKNQKTATLRGPGNRGSALLLAVGLLTILAMLGTTFLLISRMDRQRSEAISAKAPVDHLANGVLSQVVGLLKTDLYIGTINIAPYGGTTAGALGWVEYIDYADDDNTDDINDFLWYDATHLSNILGTSTADISTDGGATLNASFEDTYVMNNKGQTYNVAVRVLDMSSLINANIACGTDVTLGALPAYSAPVEIDLYGFLGGTLDNYTAINTTRGDQAGRTPAEINTNIALKLLNPTTGYSPFAIGDEMYLRWLGSNNGQTETGRLYESGTITPALRQYLTTYNVSRAIVRHPVAGLTDQTTLESSPLSNFDVYSRILQMLTKLDIGTSLSARQKMATHFVANLNAYKASGSSGAPWSYVCPDIGTYTAYGVVPQPVIVKAYASFTQSSSVLPAPPNHKWLAAVEIYVPSNAITAGLTFTLAGKDITSSIPAAGGRKIFWNYGGDYATEANALAALPAYAGTRERVDMAGLTFYNTNTIKLEVGAVVIDQVSNTDIGHTAASPTDGSATDFAMRDDNPSKARYNVAAYKKISPAPGNFNTIGLLDTDTALDADAKYSVPLSQKAADITNLGEYLQIYFTGDRKSVV